MENAKILIVDDEEKNIKLLEGILAPENYQVVAASCGEEALKQIKDHRPDLVLLDVMMPGISGFDVCRQLKRNEQTRSIPVVMVTALKENEHRICALESGADDFLNKPVDQTEMLIRIKSLLRIKSYHDELLDSWREIAAKNEILVELEKIKEGLTHMIIHDLRNPLGALIGHVQLLMLEEQNLSRDQLRSLTSCFRFCRELDDMIQSLLDIHKMEEGKLGLKKEKIHFGDVIDQTICQLTPRANQKHITLNCHKPDSLPTVAIDHSLMNRVIANLLNNAIRHTPPDGTVTITAQHPHDNRCLHIQVEDTGDGLAPEYHHKVFDKFEQPRLKRKGVKVGSSGLGLAFCKLAVEAHGGRIWVESQGEGKGANFQFTVPLDPSNALQDKPDMN